MFREFCRKEGVDARQAVYLSSPDVLRGRRVTGDDDFVIYGNPPAELLAECELNYRIALASTAPRPKAPPATA